MVYAFDNAAAVAGLSGQCRPGRRPVKTGGGGDGDGGIKTQWLNRLIPLMCMTCRSRAAIETEDPINKKLDESKRLKGIPKKIVKSRFH